MDFINGIIPPMVTPLIDDDTLDKAGLAKLIDYLIEGGVDGIFILGTTGESPSLSYSLKSELIERVCEHVNKRIPVLVGIIETSFKESIGLANKSKEFGAEAVVIASPFYFQIDQMEINDYFNNLIDEISIPAFLYNQPSLTKINIDPECLEVFLDRPEVVGFKDSSADMIYFNRVNTLTNRNNFSLMIGPEELLMESLIMGADGGIPGGANMFPRLYVNLYKEVKNGNYKSAQILHNNILKICSVIYGGSGYGSNNVINGIKYVLHYLGICSGYISKPLKKASSKKEGIINHFIEDNSRIVQNESLLT